MKHILVERVKDAPGADAFREAERHRFTENDIPFDFEGSDCDINTWDWVYLVRCDKLYKVGYTTNLRRRMYALQNGNPHKLHLVCTWALPCAEIAERELHRHLKEYKVRGEWYRLTQKVVSRLCYLAERRLVPWGSLFSPLD